MEAYIPIIIPAIVSAVFGGGTAGAIVLSAHKWHLQRHFPTRTEFDGLGKRIDVQEVSMSDLDTSLAHESERITRLEEADKRNLEVITMSVIRPMERVAAQMEEIAKTQVQQGENAAATAATLRSLANTVGSLERRIERQESKR